NGTLTYTAAADGDRGRAVRVGGGGIGERAVRRDRRLGGEERVVVVADGEGDALRRLVGWTGGDRRGPVGDGVRTTVFEHALIAALGEAGRVVDGDDGDGEA